MIVIVSTNILESAEEDKRYDLRAAKLFYGDKLIPDKCTPLNAIMYEETYY